MALERWLALGLLIGATLMPVTIDADPLAAWTPGPEAVLDNTYDGYIDVPQMNATVPAGLFTVSGWFVDSTALGWSGADDVQIWQGTMDGGGKLLTGGGLGHNRPDVAVAKGNPFWAASGFGGLVPADALGSGAQTLSVYVHTPGKGWWYKQVNVIVSSSLSPPPVAPAAGPPPIVEIEKPQDSAVVLTGHDYVMTGFALDKNAALNQGVANSGVDRLEVFIGGERDKGGTFLGDAVLGYSDATPVSTYGSQFASAGWRLTFQPTRFHINTYLLFVYARSAVTGEEEVATRYFAIRDLP